MGMRSCKVPMANDETCGQPLYDENFCVGHSPNPEKSIEKFESMVQVKMQNPVNGTIDLTRFDFPHNNYVFHFPTDATANHMVLNGAKFAGSCTLKYEPTHAMAISLGDNAVVSGDLTFFGVDARLSLKFDGIDVKGKTKLENMLIEKLLIKGCLSGECSFDGSRFARINLHGGKLFKEDVSFSKAEFSVQCILPMELFGGKVDLTEAKAQHFIVAVEKPEELEEITLTKVEWKKEGLVPALVRFFQNRYFHKFKKAESFNLSKVFGMYEQHFQKEFQPWLAKDFYVRRMEAQRDHEWHNGMKPDWLLNCLYSLISRYGGSVRRSLAWLFLTFLVCSFVLFCSGMRVPSSTTHNPRQPSDNHSNPDEYGAAFVSLSSDSTRTTADRLVDYLLICQTNFDLIGPHQLSADSVLTQTWQRTFVNAETLILLIELSFVIFALRQRFKRHAVT